MEERLKKTNECNNAAMRKMAFESHVPAYKPKELAHLPLSDLPKISTTPDIEEWGSWDTWVQAGKVAGGVVKEWTGL